MWSDKWSLLENALGQCWHWKGFAPVCFRICRVSSSERANLQVHPSQVQRYGFSPIWLKQILRKNTWINKYYIRMAYSVYLHIFSLPVCVRQWAFRWELFVYTLLQPGKLHLCVLLCSFCELSGNAFGTLSCSGLYLYIVPLIFGLTAGAWNVKCHIYVMLDMKGIGYRKLNFNIR